MQKLKSDLNAKTFERIYLFYGAEAYLCRAYRNMFRNAIVNPDDDMNYSYFENVSDRLNEVLDIADTLPFFADKRLIVLENSGLFDKDNGFADYIPNIPDTTVIILIECNTDKDKNKVDKRSRLYKAIDKNGYVCEFSEQSDEELIKFMCRKAQKDGKQLSGSDASYMLNLVGKDMNSLVNELDKLVGYIGERVQITKKDIEEICVIQIENKIFDLTDAVINKQKDTVFRIYNDLIELHESPFGILAIVKKNYSRLLELAELRDKGCGMGEICERTHQKEWLVKKKMNSIRRISVAKLKKSIEEMVNTDYAIKTGDISDRLGLEIMLANLLAI